MDGMPSQLPKQIQASNHSLHAFQPIEQMRCSRHPMAALRPALSSAFLYQEY